MKPNQNQISWSGSGCQEQPVIDLTQREQKLEIDTEMAVACFKCLNSSLIYACSVFYIIKLVKL